MRGGIWVLNTMAAVWVGAGLLTSGWPWWWLAQPVAISAGLLVWAKRQLDGVTLRDPGDHVGRVVGVWTAIEGVAIFLTANFLLNAHRADLLLPAIAIIVGLHFFGLAKGIPVRVYWATGAALTVVGAVALIAPPFHLPLVTGILCALTLWFSGIALVRSTR